MGVISVLGLMAKERAEIRVQPSAAHDLKAQRWRAVIRHAIFTALYNGHSKACPCLGFQSLHLDEA